MSKKLTKILIIVLSLTMLTGLLANIAYSAPSTDAPKVVDGRVLTPDMTGDTSNWVEIAQYGEYSLIVRAEYIKRYADYANYTYDQAYYCYDPPTTDYSDSIIRERINNWFNARVQYFGSTYSDTDYKQAALPADARLRDFAVQHDAMGKRGTSNTSTVLSDGLSLPTKYQVGAGKDIAFPLSGSEAANFLSITRMVQGGSASDGTSPPEAAANFAKISIPKISGSISGMWLRSLGLASGTVGGLNSNGFATVFTAVPQTNTQYGFVYPALWVSEGIFGTQKAQPGALIDQYAAVVDGRTLTPDMTGDICDWVEIAQNGDYSLIVRADFLNLQSFNYGDPIWQSARWQTPKDGVNNVGYTKDNVSHVINCWFNFFKVIPDPQGINTYYDVLPADARLRDFTMQHNALYTLGTRYTSTTMTDGLSTPTKYQVGVGDNIAFCLSYSEAANYLSLTHNFPGATIDTYESPPEAAANFDKVDIPNSTLGYYYAMWLRSPGNHAKTESALLETGYVHELDVLNSPAGNLPNDYAFGYGLIYPAVWVNKGIFYPDGSTVTGQVWPMLADDIWEVGDDFVASHDITVELRTTFLTPAPTELSTKSVLLNSAGLGEFTFEGVPAGDYILYISRPGYLTRAMPVTIPEPSYTTVTLSPPGTVDDGIFNLWWGDCNDDGRVDNDDILMILELMNMNVDAFHEFYNSACDMNGDGLIDNEDIQMVLEMWDVNILMYPGAEDIDPFN